MKEAEPVFRGFEYNVRLAVSIPLAWAEFLRRAAESHYDYKCRESAKAGVVNALCNTACDGEFASSHPLSWQDFDLLTKIMEQGQAVAISSTSQEIAASVESWIQQSKMRLVAREQSLARWDSEQFLPGQLGQAIPAAEPTD